MLSYFDISSAEVRSIGYLSKDPKMIELFETHQDVYVYLGKKAFADGPWDTDKSFYKNKRRIFKQVLLGSLYGNQYNAVVKLC